MISSPEVEHRVIIVNQLGYEHIRKVHSEMGIKLGTERIAVPDPAGGMRMQQVMKFDGWILYIETEPRN